MNHGRLALVKSDLLFHISIVSIWYEIYVTLIITIMIIIIIIILCMFLLQGNRKVDNIMLAYYHLVTLVTNIYCIYSSLAHFAVWYLSTGGEW